MDEYIESKYKRLISLFDKKAPAQDIKSYLSNLYVEGFQDGFTEGLNEHTF